MPAKWNVSQKAKIRGELEFLYVKKNLSLKQVAVATRLSESTIYARLKILKIPTTRSAKGGYNNVKKVNIPSKHSPKLAEFVGIMLGDGNISPTQVRVTIDSRETGYIKHICQLIHHIFRVTPKTYKRSHANAVDIYLGSVTVVRFLEKMGMVTNKVKSQVGVPSWILDSPSYKIACLRGFCDTDGSVYRLKNGQIQISLTNRSVRLLNDLREMLVSLSFRPSRVGSKSVYLTRLEDVRKYYRQVGFSNHKHSVKLAEYAGVL